MGGKPAGMDMEAAKARFLEELGRHGIVRQACRISGINRNTAYYLKGRDETFAAAWEAALADAADAVEYEAHRRSVEGVEKLVFQKGEAVIDPRTGEVYVERAYSDSILLARLKAMKPDAYRERLDVKTEMVGGALEIDPDRLLRLTMDERRTLLSLLEKLQDEDESHGEAAP